jgi:hypothetical protein
MKGHAHAGPACCYRDVQLVGRGHISIKKLASSDFFGAHTALTVNTSVIKKFRACIHRRFGGTYCLHLQCRRVSGCACWFFAWITDPKYEGSEFSSVTSVNFCQTTLRHIARRLCSSTLISLLCNQASAGSEMKHQT